MDRRKVSRRNLMIGTASAMAANALSLRAFPLVDDTQTPALPGSVQPSQRPLRSALL
jgi:hypothetical protein